MLVLSHTGFGMKWSTIETVSDRSKYPSSVCSTMGGTGSNVVFDIHWDDHLVPARRLWVTRCAIVGNSCMPIAFSCRWIIVTERQHKPQLPDYSRQQLVSISPLWLRCGACFDIAKCDNAPDDTTGLASLKDRVDDSSCYSEQYFGCDGRTNSRTSSRYLTIVRQRQRIVLRESQLD